MARNIHDELSLMMIFSLLYIFLSTGIKMTSWLKSD